jgi:hypothetical protein
MERNVAPTNWLYPDRGMVKWMGFFLADHTAYAENKTMAEQPVEEEDEQSPALISALLTNAWKNGDTIRIQLKLLEDGQYARSIEAGVGGYNNGIVYLHVGQPPFSSEKGD